MPGKTCTSGDSKRQIGKLPKRRDFLRLRSGARMSVPSFTLQAKSRPDNQKARVGYTVTTKVGNAVERNRIKRRLRAAVSQVFPAAAHKEFDYALIARRNAINAEFATIVQDLHRALDHVHANRAKGLD
ncbi:MAG: ribonuclease P protein component [Pseudomonadota bacterium]